MSLTIRKAKIIDLKKTFEWANYKDVIKNSINRNSKVSLFEHSSWFNKYVTSNKNLLFIAIHEKKKIGMVRLDNKKNEFYLGYVIDKKYRNKNFSSKMLNKVIKKMKINNKKIVFKAEIKAENLPSNRLIKGLGFRKLYSRQNNNIILYKLSTNLC
tara:strand:- start:9054 stop:9521 length:468 start_codon:yes stop_codon:yes gene_type:complete